jgi:hypothetical protein
MALSSSSGHIGDIIDPIPMEDTIVRTNSDLIVVMCVECIVVHKK